MFEDLKESFKERTEKDAVKSDIDGEIVYLKRSAGVYKLIPFMNKPMKEWHQIYPAVTEDNKWNLFNLVFGGGRNLVKLITVMLLIAMALYGFYEITSGMEKNIGILCDKEVNPNTPDNLIRAICGWNLTIEPNQQQPNLEELQDALDNIKVDPQN